MTGFEDFKRRDADFRERLHRADPTVYRDLIAAYGPSARGVIRVASRESMSREELDEGLQQVWADFWKNYDLCSPVWPFIKLIANRRGIDFLRRMARTIKMGRKGDAAGGLLLEELIEVRMPVDGRLLGDELSDLIESAASGLTQRESIAFWRRTRAASGQNWAADLAKEKGGMSSAWRKAGCDAIEKIRTRLARNPSIIAYLEKSA